MNEIFKKLKDKDSESIIMCFDIDTNTYIMRQDYDEITSIVNEIKMYLSNCKREDFSTETKKLKFYDIHYNSISNILNKHNDCLNREENKNIFLIISYWQLYLTMKYFEKYFNKTIIRDRKYYKNTLLAHRKCINCNELIVKIVPERYELEKILKIGKVKKKYYDFTTVVPELCDKCESDRLEKESIKREEENRIYEEKLSIRQEKQKEDEIKYLNHLKSIPYEDYLNTNHWKALRKRKLGQSRYKCQICASTDKLVVHHNTYENRGCENDADLVVLCDVCHKKFHNIQSDVIQMNNKFNYKIKLFELSLLDKNTDMINDFIKDNVIKLKDIKTNIQQDTYTVLLIYM